MVNFLTPSFDTPRPTAVSHFSRFQDKTQLTVSAGAGAELVRGERGETQSEIKCILINFTLCFCNDAAAIPNFFHFFWPWGEGGTSLKQ